MRQHLCCCIHICAQSTRSMTRDRSACTRGKGRARRGSMARRLGELAVSSRTLAERAWLCAGGHSTAHASANIDSRNDSQPFKSLKLPQTFNRQPVNQSTIESTSHQPVNLHRSDTLEGGGACAPLALPKLLFLAPLGISMIESLPTPT